MILVVSLTSLASSLLLLAAVVNAIPGKRNDKLEENARYKAAQSVSGRAHSMRQEKGTGSGGEVKWVPFRLSRSPMEEHDAEGRTMPSTSLFERYDGAARWIDQYTSSSSHAGPAERVAAFEDDEKIDGEVTEKYDTDDDKAVVVMSAEMKRDKVDEVWKELDLDKLGATELADHVRLLKVPGLTKKQFSEIVKWKVVREYTSDFNHAFSARLREWNYTIQAARTTLIKARRLSSPTMLDFDSREVMELAKERIRRRDAARPSHQPYERRPKAAKKAEQRVNEVIQHFINHLKERGIQYDENLSIQKMEEESRRLFTPNIHKTGYTRCLLMYIEATRPNGALAATEFRERRAAYGNSREGRSST